MSGVCDSATHSTGSDLPINMINLALRRFIVKEKSLTGLSLKGSGGEDSAGPGVFLRRSFEKSARGTRMEL